MTDTLKNLVLVIKGTRKAFKMCLDKSWDKKIADSSEN